MLLSLPSKPKTSLIPDKPRENIIDYVYNFGIIPFAEMPFTLNDGLVFAALAYIPFERCGVKKGDTIQDLCCKYLGGFSYKEELTPIQLNRMHLCMAIASSVRYSSIKVEDLLAITSKEKNMQYASISFASKDYLFVTYRGTDNTLIGWQEDFYLACYESLYSHITATDFLRNSIQNNMKKRIYVCGHSKGGNYATYSSTMIEEEYQKVITNVVIVDAPGLMKKTFNSENHDRIESRIVHIIPEDCAIGVLLHHEQVAHVVNSYPHNDLFYQHDVFMLETCGIGLNDVEDRSPLSYYVDQSCEDFLTISLATKTQRIEFFSELFQVLAVMGITKSDEIFDSPVIFIKNFLFLDKKLYDKNNKKMIMATLKEFLSCFNKNSAAYKKENRKYQKQLIERYNNEKSI